VTTSKSPTPAVRSPEAVTEFIDRLSSAMFESGMQRMPARIFAALLASESGRMTAAELSERLAVSPAAVSGGVRALMQMNMVTRERETGSRRDQYSLRDDLWYEAMVGDLRSLEAWEDSFRRGIDAVGRDTPAGARLADSLAFFQFVRAEMPALLERWREQRAQRASG